MSDKLIIEANQTLLTVRRYGDHVMFDGASPIIGRKMTAKEIFDEIGDDAFVVRLIRLNTETLVGEDITEQLANKWLHHADAEEFGIREHAMPKFVKDSRAWALWQDDVQAETPVAREPDVFIPRHGMPMGYAKGASL